MTKPQQVNKIVIKMLNEHVIESPMFEIQRPSI
jgi:hypothetical protein